LIEQHGEPAQLIFVWFSNNSRLAVVILVGVVFFFILIIVGVPRRHRGTGEAPPREDAFRHASGHVGLADGHDIHDQSLTRGRWKTKAEVSVRRKCPPLIVKGMA
jgi:hypothetical protein